MTAFEILLMIIGLILFGGSFFASEKITATREQLKVAIDEKEVKKILQLQIQDMNEDITQIINDNIQNSSSEIKRTMEKLSNEKIMAINEYSDTVIESIHKNHNEVMFLYEMLSDKNKEVKEITESITKSNKSINKRMEEAHSLTDKMDLQITFINQHINEIKSDLEEKDNEAMLLLEQENISDSATVLIQEKENKNELEDYEIEEQELLNDFTNPSQEVAANTTKNASSYNHRILEMSKEGQSALEIAKSLGLGVGEVQLVIDLFEGEK